ncbi:MAG: glucose 1-dehydrogenase, partial [Dehalococcoidia bacterium]|nr:glucose 1-dehydrogenase [Dehalococcoidia bacterium]
MLLPMFDLHGKTAIVTGGYSGIGRGIAEGLAEVGADIVICARNFAKCREAADEIAKTGVKTMAVKCDVSKSAEVDEVVRQTVEKFGKIDILVNNAGITGAAKAMVDITDEEWHHTIAVNLDGMFYFCRAAGRVMIKQNHGKIINVTSGASFKGLKNASDYNASKAGGLLLTRTIAMELVRYNIHVNLIAPGFFATNLNKELLDRVAENAKKLIPVGRMGTQEDIKGLAVFLASAASNFVT